MGEISRMSDRAILFAAVFVCGALILGAVTFGHAFPKSAFFLLPSLFYVAVFPLVVMFRGRADHGQSTRQITVALILVSLCVLLGQALITGQGVPTRWLAWGRFPLGDAGDFLANAVTLIQDGQFVSIRGRPLSSAFIAGLWRFVGFDLALLSIAMSVLCGAALYYFARVALSCFGFLGGCIAAVIAGDFLHEHIGAASTEPLGFFIGTSGFALLFAAAAKRSGLLFALGMGTLMLAFLMRVGALFIVPLLLCLPLLVPLTLRERGRWIAGALLAVAAVSVLHVSAVRSFTPDSPGFVNGPKSWYAIIAMGDEALGVRPAGSVRSEARWVQIFDDHPGLKELPIKQQGARFIEIVTTAAMERPQSVLVGALLEYKDQVFRAGLFRFIDNKPIRAIMFAMFLAGFVVSVFNARRDPVAALVMLSCVGLFLSIPLLHGGENRVHIATAALFAGTVGYFVAVGRRFVSRKLADGSGSHVGAVAGDWVYGALLLPSVALACVAYTAAKGPVLAEVKALAPGQCSEYAEAVLTVSGNGNGIALHGASVGWTSLSFDGWSDLEDTRHDWLDTAAWENLFYYAPIDSAAVPSRQKQSPETVGLLFVAYLGGDRVQGQTTGLVDVTRLVDLEGGVSYRCLMRR